MLSRVFGFLKRQSLFWRFLFCLSVVYQKLGFVSLVNYESLFSHVSREAIKLSSFSIVSTNPSIMTLIQQPYGYDILNELEI